MPPQTPDRLPHPLKLSGAALEGFEGGPEEEAPGAPSSPVKLWLKGDGKGVVDRLFRAGLGACAGPEGRVPIGATALPVLLGLLEGIPWRGGDPPVGDEVLVRMLRETDLTSRAAEGNALPGAGPPNP